MHKISDEVRYALAIVNKRTVVKSSSPGVWHPSVMKCRWRRGLIENDPLLWFIAAKN